MNRTWSNCCSVWPKRWTDGFELGVQEGTRSVRQRGQVRLKWSQMILHCEVCCQADCNPHKSCCHNNMNTRSWWLHRYRDFFTVFLMQYAVLKRKIILSNSFWHWKRTERQKTPFTRHVIQYLTKDGDDDDEHHNTTQFSFSWYIYLQYFLKNHISVQGEEFARGEEQASEYWHGHHQVAFKQLLVPL